MADHQKTIAPITESFPFDINAFKPKLTDFEVFDRGSENPEHRFSLKTSDDKYCVISEDEKFVAELMNGEKTIDEIAASFMESKGRIALTMIRNFIYRLWQEGILKDAEKVPAIEEKQSDTSLKIPIPGMDILAKILSPVLGLALLNPLSILALLGAGGYGVYILFQMYSSASMQRPLFIYKKDPTLGLLIMVGTFAAAAIIRYISRLMLHSMYKIKIKRSGIMWAQIVPGFFVDAPGVTTLKANSRFFLRTVGMIVNFGIAGVLIIITHHMKLHAETEVLMFQIAFYLILYLIYQASPILNNDLYMGCADYLDEPYLRKASFAFISRHFKRFFAQGEDEKGDNVIYLMYAAGVIFWITCTAQILLVTLSQNSSVLSGLFSTNKSASSWIILGLIILPVAVGFLTSIYLIYKFSLKSITSQDIFKNTKNLLILSAFLIFGLLMFTRIFDAGNRIIILNIFIYLSLFMAIKNSLILSRLLQKSQEQLQYFLVPFVGASIFLFLIGNHFISENTNIIFVSILLMSLTVLTYSFISLRIDWSEFMKNKRDTLAVGFISFLLLALAYYLSLHLQKTAMSEFTFHGSESISRSYIVRNRSMCIYAFIACALSLIMNVPGMVYKRGTQSFAPFFSISFGLHLLIYFVILATLKGSKIEIVESMTAAALLLAVGIGSYKNAVTGQHKNISTFPFESGEGEKDTLITAFKFITDNALNVVKCDLGEARSESISRKFSVHSQKVGWNWSLENPGTPNSDINVLGEQLNAAFQKFSSLLVRKCGQTYATSLFKEIDDHLHAGARDIIYTRVPSFTSFDSEKRHINLTFDKKKDIVDKIILFQDVKKEELPSLVQCLQSVTYQAGDLIIKQHDEGDRLFILVEGSAQVEIEDLAGNSKVVSYMTGNEFFGEIALLTSSERTASVRATEECTLLYLKRKDFDSFLGLNPERREKIMATLDYLRVIKALPLFKGLDSNIINLFASRMVKETYQKGSDIISQGDEGDKFYIILEGLVKVHVIRDDKKDHDVATLGKGEYFGEIALFKNIPRTATVTAESEEVLVISLTKEHFSKAIDSQSALESNLENVTHRRIVEMMQ